MRKIMPGLIALALIAMAVPMTAHAADGAADGIVAYKPGVLKAAIAKGETVLLDYKATW